MRIHCRYTGIKGFVRAYEDAIGKRVTVLFHGNKVLHPKVIKSVINDADVSLEEFVRLLRS